ncbi:Tubulin-specific chaperone C [Hondaea fermentalgiana]|uniref:Clathrin light chain n=1 Tax=Hondaea fermentalgiana TaxID=2315210 RepID=A0A2R5GP79_9STRA|nr:Tubulin-specific chaperone C [Hondaea fermentalgiana]|eukprot:GBG29684.1 Tubulin-specific chaperone C [Hondaea fermentalgiana]
MGTVTTPDGKEFSDPREYRRYLFEHYYSFRNRSDETLTKVPGEVNGEEFHLDGLTDCTVTILDVTNRVVVSDLTNCHVFLGPSKESVMLRKCKDCTFTVACKDLRVNSCSECTLRAFTPMPVQLDDSHHIKVGTFNGAYSGLTSHFQAVGLDASQGAAVKVKDFSERDKELPQPHFQQLSASDEETLGPWEVQLENAQGPPENPLKPTCDPAPPPPCPFPIPDPHATFEGPDASNAAASVASSVGDGSGTAAPSEAQESSQFTPETFEDDPFGSSDRVENAEQPANAGEAPVDDFFAQEDPQQIQQPEEQAQYQDFGAQPDAAQIPAEAPYAPMETAATTTQSSEAAPAPSEAAPAPSSSDFMADSDETDAREAWEAQFAERIKAKDQEAAELQAQMQEKADEELDELYAERTNKNAIRYTSNREAEGALLQEAEDSAVSDEDAPNWARIVSLIDINAKDKSDELNLDRMKNLIIQLKNTTKQQ